MPTGVTPPFARSASKTPVAGATAFERPFGRSARDRLDAGPLRLQAWLDARPCAPLRWTRRALPRPRLAFRSPGNPKSRPALRVGFGLSSLALIQALSGYPATCRSSGAGRLTSPVAGAPGLRLALGRDSQPLGTPWLLGQPGLYGTLGRASGLTSSDLLNAGLRTRTSAGALPLVCPCHRLVAGPPSWRGCCITFRAAPDLLTPLRPRVALRAL